jgi:hypothetical protein
MSLRSRSIRSSLPRRRQGRPHAQRSYPARLRRPHSGSQQQRWEYRQTAASHFACPKNRLRAESFRSESDTEALSKYGFIDGHAKELALTVEALGNVLVY